MQYKSIISSIKTLPLIIISCLLFLSIIIVFTVTFSKSAILTITTVPSDASIFINGKEYRTGTYKFSPGTIIATIQKEGYDTREITVDIEPNAYNRLFTYLTIDNTIPYTEDDFDYDTLVQISNISDDTELKSYIQKTKDKQNLKSFLPLYYEDIEKNQYINISYNTDNCKKQDYCILITDAIEGNYDFAISLLKKYGYSKEDYEIVYEYSCKKGDSECARL